MITLCFSLWRKKLLRNNIQIIYKYFQGLPDDLFDYNSFVILGWQWAFKS